MLLEFLECFSLEEEKKIKHILPTLPCSDMAELSYSKHKTKKKYCPLFRALGISSIALGYIFQLFSFFINQSVYSLMLNIRNIRESIWCSSLRFHSDYNMQFSVLRATVCIEWEDFLELSSSLKRKIFFYWDMQPFFLKISTDRQCCEQSECKSKKQPRLSLALPLQSYSHSYAWSDTLS